MQGDNVLKVSLESIRKMPSILDDDDDRDLIGSQDGSSDGGMDDTMHDMDDMEVDVEPEPEPEPEPNSPSNSSVVDSEHHARNTQNPEVIVTAPALDPVPDQPFMYRPQVRQEALTAATYDIVPTTAAPHSTSINAVTSTADMRWVFTGGSDGYVRRFNWADSINSKLMLTVAQRHPFVDSVVKAGVLVNYWENMDGTAMSPVYSLAAQAEGLWLLSGLESGFIRLQSVRHDEGKEIAVLKQHTSAVSVLSLTQDERSLLSGSWDKRVLEWDLDTGKVKRTFGSSIGQVSAIEFRPESSLPVPREIVERPLTNGTYSSNNRAAPSASQSFVNGGGGNKDSQTGDQQAGSPADSLFEADSLFGDAEGGGDADAPSGGAFAAEDDEFSQALANGMKQKQQAARKDADDSSTNAMTNGTVPYSEPLAENVPKPDSASQVQTTKQEPEDSQVNGISDSVMSGLPHAEDLESSTAAIERSTMANDINSVGDSNSTFLTASIDGTIRVWDRRQSDPISRITPRNSPPWCMSACWSPDGNYIYAGRRNGTVEEYSLHKGLRDPQRTFKFPHGSGAVSSVKIMPNGRHLICASHDILRLYDLAEEQSSRSSVPFLIIPGHRTGTISQLYMDNACKYLISTGGNRGWEGSTTEVLLGYEISALQS
ncbi:transcription factor SPT8 [Nannizzia gypsea CBS 118893]|uniref:Transcription factor SPT8 n=1 Tax=Arthroderma gypseum (strain ATCC MYA-4604 / CBS 118893) TaxID=535722 RepID=E4UUK7_ARTGP|nr:transcription factor SPT8 [Nannizzia gypsea CBS 118893]EFR00974.1 transcription factor SPT8 [Nannizzia gypsea CBS 118893]